jgi:hypothetical protein
MKATRRYAAGLAAVVATAASLLAVTGLGAGAAGASSFPAFVAPLHHITTLASTVPANGDVNPYGVAVIPRGTGHLGRGNILVSNFNNKANVQGTGTTIVQITQSGRPGSASAGTARCMWPIRWRTGSRLSLARYSGSPTRAGASPSARVTP